MGTNIWDELGNELEKSWPGPLVARKEVSKFSGGLLCPRTMANLDARRIGPPKIKIGKKVGYLKRELIQWMRNRDVGQKNDEGTED